MIDHQKIERAIIFLSEKIKTSNHNPKPVLLHSLRIGLQLMDEGQPEDIVLGALLHDLIEDTDTTLKEIETLFGSNVKDLVSANSYDEGIEDNWERYKDLVKRCLNRGKSALIIKTADILDNYNYYLRITDKQKFDSITKKRAYFLEETRSIMENDPRWQKLAEKTMSPDV